MTVDELVVAIREKATAGGGMLSWSEAAPPAARALVEIVQLIEDNSYECDGCCAVCCGEPAYSAPPAHNSPDGLGTALCRACADARTDVYECTRCGQDMFRTASGVPVCNECLGVTQEQRIVLEAQSSQDFRALVLAARHVQEVLRTVNRGYGSGRGSTTVMLANLNAALAPFASL